MFNCLKIVQLVCDLMRFMSNGGALAQVMYFLKAAPKSGIIIRGRIEKQSHEFSKCFLLDFFVCFFKDQIQRAFSAFLH